MNLLRYLFICSLFNTLLACCPCRGAAFEITPCSAKSMISATLANTPDSNTATSALTASVSDQSSDGAPTKASIDKALSSSDTSTDSSLFLLPGTVTATGRECKVYTFPINGDIMPAQQRLVSKCLTEAREQETDLVVIRMNTYGGLVNVADSIRTMILNYPTPIWVYIDNQAASAGALIALAADRIYMHPGGSIGAASVVDQNGQPMPDKFQSFMRATMRATAESHGQVIERIENGDTIRRWWRDPQTAEAMVGRTVADSTTVNVLTFTASEAVKNHFSEGTASSLEETLAQGGVETYTLTEYRPTTLDRLLAWLMNPVVQGIFVMMIVGGIYFELQSPGIGFALVVAILGAVLYFAPLYLEGVAQNWELILFIIGLVLLAVEIFVLPGFGIAGVAGIVAVILGLSFAAIDNDLLRHLPTGEITVGWILQPILIVIIAATAALIGGLLLSKRFLTGTTPLQRKVVLTAEMAPEQGYVSHPQVASELIGKTAEVAAVLRPSGRVIIDGIYYDAIAEEGQFIPRGKQVIITRFEGGFSHGFHELVLIALNKIDSFAHCTLFRSKFSDNQKERIHLCIELPISVHSTE